jgi:hypothetical protein
MTDLWSSHLLKVKSTASKICARMMVALLAMEKWMVTVSLVRGTVPSLIYALEMH